MYKSDYLNRLLENAKKKYSNEKEYIDAVTEFFDSMDYLVSKDPKIEENAILERLIEPERTITFRVPWVDDNGKIQVNTGYRVQFNSAIGPYKGGLRFDKSVNLSILKFLGFEQTFKNSLTGLPLGGGKGGSDFDPTGKSDNEIMRFCQSFMAELYKYIGPDVDIPAGDIGVGAREIGYLFGYYKKLTNRFNGSLTGKDVSFGGSLLRPESTGYGLLYFTEEMHKTFFNKDLKGKRVLISGFGKVAKMAIKKSNELGCVLVGTSNIDGCLIDPNGLDVNNLLSINSFKEYVELHPTSKYIEGSVNLWNEKCDIALPCATQNEIYLEQAKLLKDNGCLMVVEGANMPCNIEAIRYFKDNNILFAPGKAANAGGVAASGLEMSQNAEHISWSADKVETMLKEIMSNIFKQCYETAKEYGDETNIALGANIAGFKKVYKAMMFEGIC